VTVHAIEDAIVERLKARLITEPQAPIVRNVYHAAEVAQMEERLQLSPSVTVIYNGYRTGEQIAQGGIQQVTFTYLVVVMVRNAKAAGTSQGVREDAAPILDACMEALLGFRPVQGCTPLRLQDAPGAGFSDAGAGYYPLAFDISRTYRGIA
jgi:hypothetical protein